MALLPASRLLSCGNIQCAVNVRWPSVKRNRLNKTNADVSRWKGGPFSDMKKATAQGTTDKKANPVNFAPAMPLSLHPNRLIIFSY